MPFKEMDPELALRLIEGYQDEITPAVEAQEAKLRKFYCPRCKGGLQKEFDIRTCFKPDEILAQPLLRCRNCGYLIDPATRVVIEFGDASKIPVESSPLILPDM
jgi:rubredoxin